VTYSGHGWACFLTGYNPTGPRTEGGTPEERPGRTASGRSRCDRLWRVIRQQGTGNSDKLPGRHARRDGRLRRLPHGHEPGLRRRGDDPVKYTCTAPNPVSPPLAWSGVPSGTAELTLLVEDPDASPAGFVHWVVYGIPPETQGLAEGSLPSAARQGANGRNQDQWAGPCPPVGSAPHHYRFTLTAVSKSLGLAPGATAAQVKAAIAGSIVGQGLLVGRYRR